MDIRDTLFSQISEEQFTAEILPEQNGIVSGVEKALHKAGQLGVRVIQKTAEGEEVVSGQPVLTIEGTPKQLALAEEELIGTMAKASGIASAAKAFCERAEGRFRVVSGAWKKVNLEVKDTFRKAIVTGGCGCRILDEPMVYIDKNYVIMLGGIRKALMTLDRMPELKGRKKVIQVKGTISGLGLECWTAAEYGADVIYVDTGCVKDMEEVQESMQYMQRVPMIAFGGGITLETVEELKKYPVDIIGVGRAIIDAPMLDMKMDVVPKGKLESCECED